MKSCKICNQIKPELQNTMRLVCNDCKTIQHRKQSSKAYYKRRVLRGHKKGRKSSFIYVYARLFAVDTVYSLLQAKYSKYILDRIITNQFFKLNNKKENNMIQLKLVQKGIIPTGYVEIYHNLPFACDFFYSIVCKKSEFETLKAMSNHEIEDESFEFSREDLKRIMASLGDEYDQSDEGLDNILLTTSVYNDSQIYLEFGD